MNGHCVALFGEAERGSFNEVYHCRSLPDLVHKLGNPPENTKGLHYAIQSILFGHDLLFFRVKEEGYGMDDYLRGIGFLEKLDANQDLLALCLPGVGSEEIFKACSSICKKHHSVLVTNESDFYDYITEKKNFV